jgi:hypothetical protein
MEALARSVAHSQQNEEGKEHMQIGFWVPRVLVGNGEEDLREFMLNHLLC